MRSDILIIGGGASGLAAAVVAKRRSPHSRVCIVEHNARIGKKILATGNGRCNLGNLSDHQDVYYGSVSNIQSDIWESTQNTVDFFRTMGLICRHEADGRLYPHSNQAVSVLDALHFTAEQLQIEMLCDCTISTVQREAHYFLIQSSLGDIQTDVLILCTGGLAAPKTGSDGTAFEWLKSFGHTTVHMQPALAPLYTNPELVRPLKGVRITATVCAISKSGKRLCTESGEVQFTERALSGICVMNLSARCSNLDPSFLSLNLLPEYNAQQVSALLWELYAQRAQWKIEDWLSGLFPKKIGLQLLRTCHITALHQPVYTILSSELELLAEVCQNWKFPVVGRGNWQEAQVTAGGIPLKEIDINLQSKKVAGLFFAGEILDLHGICGGYNLNWAWRSGQYVGQTAVQYLREECTK